MILICPSCGAAHSAEGWENDAVARQTLQASCKLPSSVNQVVLAYIGLFRPAKQALRWKKSFKLINELAAMIAPGHVQIHGKVARPCPHHIWALGMEKMVDRRPQLDLPLKNHNYLIQVVYQLADQADAGREQLQRRSEADGSASVNRLTLPFPPAQPVGEELSQLERQYLERHGFFRGWKMVPLLGSTDWRLLGESEMGNEKSKAMTALESMSKEELIELIKNRSFLFMPCAEQHIKDARGRVARRHADQAFEQYEKLANQAMDMPKDTIDQLVAWGQKYKEAERFLHKYERLWKRADILQFGPKKKEVTHAAE